MIGLLLGIISIGSFPCSFRFPRLSGTLQMGYTVKYGFRDFSWDFFSSFWNTLFTWLAPSLPLGLGSKSPFRWCFLRIYYLKWHPFPIFILLAPLLQFTILLGTYSYLIPFVTPLLGTTSYLLSAFSTIMSVPGEVGFLAGVHCTFKGYWAWHRHPKWRPRREGQPQDGFILQLLRLSTAMSQKYLFSSLWVEEMASSKIRIRI